mmetsp:Transcript_25545/g.73481  ORF Transcript_25545/g.73481 Transcript_25545/m.73481 type:complete len:371 (+) Transcript_25545:2809-3921(+)
MGVLLLLCTSFFVSSVRHLKWKLSASFGDPTLGSTAAVAVAVFFRQASASSLNFCCSSASLFFMSCALVRNLMACFWYKRSMRSSSTFRWGLFSRKAFSVSASAVIRAASFCLSFSLPSSYKRCIISCCFALVGGLPVRPRWPSERLSISLLSISAFNFSFFLATRLCLSYRRCTTSFEGLAARNFCASGVGPTRRASKSWRSRSSRLAANARNFLSRCWPASCNRCTVLCGLGLRLPSEHLQLLLLVRAASLLSSIIRSSRASCISFAARSLACFALCSACKSCMRSESSKPDVQQPGDPTLDGLDLVPGDPMRACITGDGERDRHSVSSKQWPRRVALSAAVSTSMVINPSPAPPKKFVTYFASPGDR